MNKALTLLRSLTTNGADHQAFIGAAWLRLLLHLTPRRFKRPVALWIVSLSPHYFYRELRPEYQSLPLSSFLEAECERNRSSRARICEELLAPYLPLGARALDLGCGPGFLAKAVAGRVGAVFACDISRGVLACAEVLNAAPNLHYLFSGESGFAQIEDGSLDLVYSIAVIQHVREAVIRYLFSVASRKLRPGGIACFQVQLEAPQWKSETEWTADTSLPGRLKLQYALNFFARSEGFFRSLAAEVGLSLTAVRPLCEVLKEPFDDIYYQHLVVLEKPEGAV